MIINSLLLLQYLLYMNPAIGLNFDITTEHCFGLKSGANIRSCNRVLHTSPPATDEITTIKSFFAETPFTWAINVDDHASRANGLDLKGTFPALSLNLNNLPQIIPNEALTIKHVNIHSFDDLSRWIYIVSTLFHGDEREVYTFIQFLNERAPSACKLYSGFYQNTPASACLMIVHEKIATLHWVGTLPEYRNKNLGFTISHQALSDAKNLGCTQALLMSSQMGKHLYERLGFIEYAVYDLYGN